jgi:hypothetical protein
MAMVSLAGIGIGEAGVVWGVPSSARLLYEFEFDFDFE